MNQLKITFLHASLMSIKTLTSTLNLFKQALNGSGLTKKPHAIAVQNNNRIIMMYGDRHTNI